MAPTTTYVFHPGWWWVLCACSDGGWSAPWAGEAGCSGCWWAISSSLLDQVHEREDHDPDDVDEVPVQRREIHVQRVVRAEAALDVDREERPEPEHARRHVRAVEAGEREERRPEQVGAEREPLVDERGELVRLEAEEDHAEDGRHGQPQLRAADEALEARRLRLA